MRKKPHGAAAPLIAVDRKSEKPLHRQIYDAFREMILDRRLQPEQQIPSTRALADDLGISRIPVLDAYAQLLAEGVQKCANKFGEEAVEAALAAVSKDKAALAAESADVLYHLLVLWAASGIKPDEVYAALKARESQSGLADKASRKR